MELQPKPPSMTGTQCESSAEAKSVSAEGEFTNDQQMDSQNPKTIDSEQSPKGKTKAKQPPVLRPNRVRQSRIESMMSKAELARRANLSVLTIDRVEKGFGCRMHTKRKILEALGLSLADRVRVFGEEEE